jgi:hypothetical protein
MQLRRRQCATQRRTPAVVDDDIRWVVPNESAVTF